MTAILSVTCYAFAVVAIFQAVSAVENGTPVLDPVPGAERPYAIANISLYGDFYDRPELYRRLHVVIDRVERDPEVPLSFIWQINSPDAYVAISTVGSDTGSTDYFKIGSFKTKTVHADNKEGSLGIPNPLYSWDEKALILYKISGTEEIECTILDKDPGADDLLMRFSVPLSELPEPGDGYVEFRRSHTSDEDSAYSEMEGSQLVFRVKVTEMSEPFTSKADNENAKSSIIGKLEYQEHVLNLDQEEKALLQSWTHTDGEQVDGAVLWVIGRNDCFMHPHVLNQLFLNDANNGDNRYDVFVLNWRYNGQSRFRGWLTDAFFNTHVKNGDFDPYIQEITLSLEHIQDMSPTGEGYSTLLGYAHSTGAPLLLNYIIENGDDAFDAILFNSPFFDWPVGGDSELMEFVENALSSFLADIDLPPDDKIFFPKTTPVELGEPIPYLNRSVAPSAWSARIYSQYRVDWAVRPLYSVPVTAGFAKAVTRLHEKIRNAGVITTKPMLVLKSKADDVLTDWEIDILSGQVNPEREIFSFEYNHHDVFLSGDEEDTIVALEVANEWLTRTKALLANSETLEPTTTTLAGNTAAPKLRSSAVSGTHLLALCVVAAVMMQSL